MTPDEILDLLSLIAAYDQRTVGDADVEAWFVIAEAEHWTWPLARRAVIEHHRRGGDRPRIRPAHITDAIRTVEDTIRRTVLHTDLTPPRGLADDPSAENAWRRQFIGQAKAAALAAWADNGDPRIALPAAPQPPAANRQLVDADGDPTPELAAAADATRVPAVSRRDPVDANQHAERRQAARRELDAIRGQVMTA